MAGNLDLQVHIYSVEVENDPNKVPEVLSTILGPQFCARIVDLRIETIDYRSTSTEWIGNFPKLRSLQFSYLREGSLQSLIATRSMVRTLTLYYDCAVSALPDSTWSGLRSLKVERMSAENVHQLLPKLAQIEHLTGLPMSWPNKNTPPFTLPYLEEISLSCDPAWIHILTMPKLKKLHLIQEKPRRSDAQSDNQGRDKSSKDLSFPDLEYLDVTTNSPSFLSKYHLPSLRSIRLSSESFDFHKRHRLLPFKCSNTLSELILEGGCSTDVILDALRKASLLRVFKLEKYRAKDHVGLIDVLAITDKPHVICPRLEQVSLSFRYSGDFNIAEQDPAPYQKVKDARQCAGLPFYVFDLNYRETYRTLHRRL
ncbi:hypothetical protein FRC19_009188 [Serendipita sp. 401]|nr:hypothetical protein FRC19_009188 [Serendipita sp. 401]KAG9058409.1 hypothetical protein FS842_009477 [Serendipita sp. 407]